MLGEHHLFSEEVLTRCLRCLWSGKAALLPVPAVPVRTVPVLRCEQVRGAGACCFQHVSDLAKVSLSCLLSWLP